MRSFSVAGCVCGCGCFRRGLVKILEGLRHSIVVFTEEPECSNVFSVADGLRVGSFLVPDYGCSCRLLHSFVVFTDEPEYSVSVAAWVVPPVAVAGYCCWLRLLPSSLPGSLDWLRLRVAVADCGCCHNHHATLVERMRCDDLLYPIVMILWQPHHLSGRRCGMVG